MSENEESKGRPRIPAQDRRATIPSSAEGSRVPVGESKEKEDWVEPVRQKWRKSLTPSLGAALYTPPPTEEPPPAPLPASGASALLGASLGSLNRIVKTSTPVTPDPEPSGKPSVPEATIPPSRAPPPVPTEAAALPPGAGQQLMCPMTGMLTMWRKKAATNARTDDTDKTSGKPESKMSPTIDPSPAPKIESSAEGQDSPIQGGRSSPIPGKSLGMNHGKLMSDYGSEPAADWPAGAPVRTRRSSIGSNISGEALVPRTASGDSTLIPRTASGESQAGAVEQTPEQALKEAKAMNFLRRKFGLAPLPLPGDATPEETVELDPEIKPLMGGKLAEILKRRAERARENIQVRQQSDFIRMPSTASSIRSGDGARRAGPQVYEKMGGYGESGTGNFLHRAGSTRNTNFESHAAKPRSMAAMWSIARQSVLRNQTQAPVMMRQQTFVGDTNGDNSGRLRREPTFGASGVFRADGGGFNQSMMSRRSKRSASGSSVTGSQASGMTGRERRKGFRPRGKKDRTRKAPTFSEYDVATHVPTIIDSWLRMQTLVDWQTIGMTLYTHLFELAPQMRDLFNTTDSAKQGQLFAKMINEMVTAIDNPSVLHEKLRVLAPMHRRKGVSVEMMPHFAKAMVQTVSTILGTEMTVDIQTSWEWLWGWLHKSMAIVLEDAQVDATVVTQSWDLANDNVSEDAMGCVMYDTLFSMAPNLKSEFPKPRQMLSVKFMEMLTTLVSFHGDPARMEEQIIWVALRHLKYGAKAIHGPAMGQVVIATMQSAMGDDWSDDLQSAWTELWETTSSAMISLLEEAEKHGEVARLMWIEAKRNLTADSLGSCICRKLIQLNHDLLTTFYKKHYGMPNREAPKVAPQSNLRQKHKPSVQSVESSQEVQSSQEGDREKEALTRKRRKTQVHVLRRFSEIGSVMGSVKMSNTWVGRRASALGLPIALTPPEHMDIDEVEEEEEEEEDRGPSCCAAGFGTARSAASGALSSVKSALSSCPRRAFDNISSKISFSRRKGHDDESDDGLVDDDGEAFERKPGKGINEAQAVGIEFLDMMNSIVDLLWEPEQQRENLTVLAYRLHELGILVSHLKQIGDGIKEGIKRSVSDFTTEKQEAFDWLWNFVSSGLASGMNAMEFKSQETIKNSWALVKESKSVEEIGEEIFTELVKLAPHVLHLFNRPKKIQAAQFVSAVEMVCLFSRDPLQFFHDLKGLTIRHIKYGVKADYVKPFGRAILLAIQKCLGEAWTPEVKRAWDHLWLKVSCSVASCLSVGTSLVNVALVQGDLAKLVEAIECAPRGQRSQWLTEVTVHGSIVSPLYWAIRDGKFSMAKYILDDLLAIRADREAYYYGRETLWATHQDMIHMLCKECPMLLEDVLDGLMWHAHTVLDGTIRVNYYIQELYGDPWSDFIKDPWKSPLATLTLEGEPQMFMHPAIAKVLDLKWNRFGRQGFLTMQIFWALQLALYAAGFVFLRNECTASSIGIRLLVGGISVCIFCFYMVFTIQQHRSGQVIPVSMLKIKFNCPRFFANPWNSTRIFTNAIMILVSFLEPCIWEQSMVPGTSGDLAAAEGDGRRLQIPGLGGFGDLFFEEGGRRSPSCPLRGGYVNLPDVDISWRMVLNAITTFSTCIQFVQLLTINDKLAAFTYTIGRMFEDVYRNLLVISIIMVSFAATLSVMREDSFQTFDVSIVGLLRTIVGLHSPSTTYVSSPGAFVIILFVVIIDIGFLNILIAQLALAYESLTKETAGFSRMNRAFTTVEIESLMPLATRRKIFLELQFDQPLEFDNGDSGPSGGIQVLEPASVRADPRYVPDRIMRFTGEANEHDPWPSEALEDEEAVQAVDMEG